MLTSPALLSMVSNKSASTRAISTRSAGTVSRPGSTGAVLISRVEMESSPSAGGAAVSGNTSDSTAFGDTPGVDTPSGGAAGPGSRRSAPGATVVRAAATAAAAGVATPGATTCGVAAAGATTCGVAAPGATTCGVTVIGATGCDAAACPAAIGGATAGAALGSARVSPMA